MDDVIKSQLNTGLDNPDDRQRLVVDADKATNNQLRRCNCGKVLESSNKKHLICKDCFEKTKTNACVCGKKIVPTRYCCFKFSKDKSKAAHAESK